MDSLTQIVLGAAVGEVLLGRQLGNKAMLLGAIGGTLPDMDVLYNFVSNDPIDQLRVHRAYSHSVFTHLLAAVPLAMLSNYFSRHSINFQRWYLFWFLALFTHALLDCCTTYGTRLFLPFTDYQVAFNNISVIDPVYTLPFLFLLIIAMFFHRESDKRRKLVNASLIISSCYMLLTFGLKYSVHKRFEKSLQEHGIAYRELSSTPTILNSVLWSGIAVSDSVLYVAEYSFLNDQVPVRWIPYRRNLELETKFDSPAFRTVKWFSDGNYFIEADGENSIIFYSVKFGRMRFDADEANQAFFFHWRFYVDDHQIRYEEIRRDDWKFSEALEMLMVRIGI